MDAPVDNEAAATNDEPQSDVIVRTFAATLKAGDGRTIDVRIVPYGTKAIADDGKGGVPKGIPYSEEFVLGAFAEQARAAEVGRAKHVLVNFEHERGLGGVVGHGLMLREQTDGFYGSFRVHDTADGDKALMMVNEDILRGVSLEAIPKKSVRTAAGVIQRVKAHLRGIALCRDPAYFGASVLAVRTAAPLFEEALLPTEPDPEQIERWRRLGVTLPDRYTSAHPEETGTPL